MKKKTFVMLRRRPRPEDLEHLQHQQQQGLCPLSECRTYPVQVFENTPFTQPPATEAHLLYPVITQYIAQIDNGEFYSNTAYTKLQRVTRGFRVMVRAMREWAGENRIAEEVNNVTFFRLLHLATTYVLPQLDQRAAEWLQSTDAPPATRSHILLHGSAISRPNRFVPAVLTAFQGLQVPSYINRASTKELLKMLQYLILYFRRWSLHFVSGPETRSAANRSDPNDDDTESYVSGFY